MAPPPPLRSLEDAGSPFKQPLQPQTAKAPHRKQTDRNQQSYLTGTQRHDQSKEPPSNPDTGKANVRRVGARLQHTRRAHQRDLLGPTSHITTAPNLWTHACRQKHTVHAQSPPCNKAQRMPLGQGDRQSHADPTGSTCTALVVRSKPRDAAGLQRLAPRPPPSSPPTATTAATHTAHSIGPQSDLPGCVATASTAGGGGAGSSGRALRCHMQALPRSLPSARQSCTQAWRPRPHQAPRSRPNPSGAVALIARGRVHPTTQRNRTLPAATNQSMSIEL